MNEFQMSIEAIEAATRAYPIHFEMWYNSKNEWVIKIKDKFFKDTNFVTVTGIAMRHIVDNYLKEPPRPRPQE